MLYDFYVKFCIFSDLIEKKINIFVVKIYYKKKISLLKYLNDVFVC